MINVTLVLTLVLPALTVILLLVCLVKHHTTLTLTMNVFNALLPVRHVPAITQAIVSHVSLHILFMLKMVRVFSVLILIVRFVLELTHQCAMNALMVSCFKTINVLLVQPTVKDVFKTQYVPIVWMAMDIQVLNVCHVRVAVSLAHMMEQSVRNVLKECM